jgi:hypothetical protein
LENERGDLKVDWAPLESKLLTAAAYVEERRILYLRFHSGDVYRYFDFPPALYRDFLGAESKGQFFLSKIRSQFRYERLARLKAANM